MTTKTKFFTALCLGILWWFAPATQAASGDILVRLTDMYNQAIAGTNGGTASLVGTDARGALTLGPKAADARGVVQFSAGEISAFTSGPFQFVIYTSGTNSSLQGKLYDPFGPQWTYINYTGDTSYDFTIPTPTVGSPQPKVAWNKTRTQFSFAVDLGQRQNRDFWFTRVVLQKKATELAHAGSDFGLTPVISDAWISGNHLIADDGGLAPGQIGSLRLTGPDYDQTFMVRKSQAGPSAQYQVFLVNCLWNRDLVGLYDPGSKTYTVEFDPSSVFTDPSAPAWDGFAMKPEVEYFAVLQAETWLANSAGSKGGLALAFGPPVAESLLYPLRPAIEELQVRSISISGADCALELVGPPGDFIIEHSVDLKQWQVLGSGVLTTSTAQYVDRNAPKGTRFYRVRRGGETEELRVRSITVSGTDCTLELAGPPGDFIIEHSADLRRWQVLGSGVLTTSTAQYVDRNAPKGIRFYRVRRGGEPLQMRVSALPGGACELVVSGPTGLTTIESTVSLAQPRWTTLVSTNITSMPFVYTDPGAAETTRFYRVRQP
ncbi:MAG: hypothetical protein AB9869_38225 [Verrucomicrobiia bacterium]